MTQITEHTQIRPADILASRRWHSALFTTYAFSVSFFESVVFQALTKRMACHDICVLIDAEGYASSLMERRAARVGRDYTLIPVLAPGVFHPKCTYLSGPDGDLLLVGSGNLTFGGYGRNVEVLEVLQPEMHSQAFLDFADFLEALVAKPQLKIPNPACVAHFVERARNAARSGLETGKTDSIRLLHSSRESIVNQLASYTAAYGAAQRITVLSPFHDANGASIAELARVMRCQDIRIALPPYLVQVTTFPFHLAPKLKLNISAVIPKMEEETGRSLHAKWIEIVTPNGTITLTGSVNATYPALCSTRNIEVGIIRHSGTPVERWDDAAIPVTQEIETEPTQEGSRPGLVYTRLTAGGRIDGHLMIHREVTGRWQLRFEKSGQSYLDLSVDVDQAGHFTATCANANEILSIGTVRVRLSRDDSQTIGWLEMEELVRMSLEQRSIFSALSRFLSKQATDDDDVSLLNYLAISSAHHLDELAPEDLPTSASGDSDRDAPGENDAVPLSLIAPSEDAFEGHRPRALGLPVANTLAHWFRQFRDQVLSPDSVSSYHNTREPKRAAHPSESDEEMEEEQEQERTSRALDGFERKMLGTLHDTSDLEAKRKLLCIWHEVTIYMQCQRLGTPEECPVFLRRWLGYVQQFATAREIPEALEKFFFSSVAMLAFYGMQEESKQSLQHLHESLERFCGRQVTAEFANSALDRRWEQGVAKSILGIEAPRLDVYLVHVLNTKTSLDEIQVFFTAIRERRLVDFSSGIFTATSRYGQEVGTELRKVIENANAIRYLVPRLDDRLDSSCCFRRFPENAKASYAVQRVAKCEQCGKFNLRLLP